jgi:DNA-binding HxlR family transcriptional regulator
MFPSNTAVPQKLRTDLNEHSECVVVREILDRVGDKWSVLVIALLGVQGQRFSELRRSIEGISQRMLTLTLRQLERDGLVARTVHPTVPPRVDYALTPLGQSVLEPIMALMHWAQEHGTDIAEARRQYEEDQLEEGQPAEGVAR